MKITPINFFNDKAGSCSAGFENIEDISEYHQNPPFISVENEFYDDELFVCNQHEDSNPKYYETHYSEDVIPVGMWIIEYKKTIKQLLQLLLYECIKRDFKTLCSDGKMRHTGMCTIADDLTKQQIISKEEYWIIKKIIGENRPEDANDAHWYESTPEGNEKRIQFLETQINQQHEKV